MLPGGLVKYKSFIVHLFEASAGGLRVAAIKMLISKMPVERASFLTGHQLKGIGALFEYLRVEVRD